MVECVLFCHPAVPSNRLFVFSRSVSRSSTCCLPSVWFHVNAAICMNAIFFHRERNNMEIIGKPKPDFTSHFYPPAKSHFRDHFCDLQASGSNSASSGCVFVCCCQRCWNKTDVTPAGCSTAHLPHLPPSTCSPDWRQVNKTLFISLKRSRILLMFRSLFFTLNSTGATLQD